MKEVKEIIANRVGIPIEEIKNTERLETLGIDSLKLVEIIVEIEDKLGICFDDEDLELTNINITEDLCNMVEKHL